MSNPTLATKNDRYDTQIYKPTLQTESLETHQNEYKADPEVTKAIELIHKDIKRIDEEIIHKKNKVAKEYDFQDLESRSKKSNKIKKKKVKDLKTNKFTKTQ